MPKASNKILSVGFYGKLAKMLLAKTAKDFIKLQAPT